MAVSIETTPALSGLASEDALHTAAFTPAIAREEFSSLTYAVRKMCAVSYLTEQAVMAEIQNASAPAYHTVQRLWTDTIQFANEFTKGSFAQTVEGDLIRQLNTETRKWIKNVCQNTWTTQALTEGSIPADEPGKIWTPGQAALPDTQRYFENVNRIYAELNGRTALANFAGAAELGLSVLDFETRHTGVPYAALSCATDLFNALLIDPSKPQPQEGFIRRISIAEMAPNAQLLQTRLFAVFRDSAIRGFCMPTYNSESCKRILGDNYNRLLDAGVIAAKDHLAWVHYVASASQDRLLFGRSGLTVYSILTPLMNEGAIDEGANVLLGSVREGTFANTSIKAHLRQGWQMTGVVYMGPDGETPYRIVYKRLADKPFETNRLGIGQGSHFRMNHHDPILHEPAAETAVPITNSEALSKVECYFSGVHGIRVGSQYGERFYISVEYGNCQTEHLHQILPGADLWRHFGSDKRGTLDSLLPEIGERLGVVSRKWRLW